MPDGFFLTVHRERNGLMVAQDFDKAQIEAVMLVPEEMRKTGSTTVYSHVAFAEPRHLLSFAPFQR